MMRMVMGKPLELQVYLSFLNNVLKIFHDVVLLLERDDGTVCELYDIMLTLKTKLQQRQIDSFFGMETSAILQQFPDQKAAAIKHDLSKFYQAALNYLEKWYDFTDNNYQKNVASLALKSKFTFSHLCDAVEVLQIRGKLDMDELYDEYCVTLPRQQDVVERRAPVVEKWSTLLQGTNTPNLTAVASFLLSIPITNASINFEYSCKEFYTYALKEKALLEAVRSSKKYKVKKSI
ncbi:hypothetical protein KUCAC02_013730 [Chaenocephalus aceratus]|uniref:Uncharacterized protein n=1 Tax=Chaenocephalus aceratus TaxID=36190 RepID=A0ACB9WDG3_CHAAC|nr:hypothetical protein KUCAC02_013730 [Chaenocephalus aceratus]